MYKDLIDALRCDGVNKKCKDGKCPYYVTVGKRGFCNIKTIMQDAADVLEDFIQNKEQDIDWSKAPVDTPTLERIRMKISAPEGTLISIEEIVE